MELNNASGQAENIWPGPINVFSRTYQTGIKYTRGNRDLASVIAKNKKVRDLRIIDSIINIKLNETAIETIQSQIEKSQHRSYVSDAKYIQDTKGNVRIFFSFDYLSYLKDNSIFGNLYKNDSSLLEAAKIHEVEIVRQRVENQPTFNRLTGGEVSNRIYHGDRYSKIVGSGFKNNIKSIRLNLLNDGIINFICVDNEMQYITAGLYQYGVNMTIADNTKEKILSFFEGDDENPGLGELMAEFSEYEFIAEKHFLPFCRNGTGVFPPKFASQFTKKGSGIWNKLVDKYMEIMRFVLGPGYIVDNYSLDKIESNLKYLISPDTGTVNGIYLVHSVIESFMGDLRALVATPPAHKILDATLKVRTDRRTKSFPSRLSTLSTYFNSAYMKHGTRLGFDYLSTTEPPHRIPANGLKSFNYNEWMQRTDIEAKIYSIGNAQVFNQHGYLSPLRVFLDAGPSTPLLDPGDENQDNIDNVIYKVLLNNDGNSALADYSDVYSPVQDKNILPDRQKALTNLQLILAKNSCTIETISSARSNLFASHDSQNTCATTNFESKMTDAEKYLGDDSKFTKDVFMKDSDANGSAQNILTKVGSLDRLRAYNSDIAKLLIEPDLKAGITKSDPVLRGKLGIFPDINESENVGSLAQIALINETTDASKLDPLNAPNYVIQWGLGKKIQFLSGYEVKTGKTMIKKAIWLDLDSSIFQNAKDNKKTLLCRMIDTHSPLEANGLKLPSFDEYFIIGTQILSETFAGASRGAPKITSIDADHSHEYIVDVFGNGVALTAVSPQNPNIKHFHEIVEGVVQAAQSECYPNCEEQYGVPGAAPHNHSLVATAGPSAYANNRDYTQYSDYMMSNNVGSEISSRQLPRQPGQFTTTAGQFTTTAGQFTTTAGQGMRIGSRTRRGGPGGGGTGGGGTGGGGRGGY